MDILWHVGSGTVQEIVAALPEPLAYTTVLTTLQILERKAYIRHEKDGRAYRYFPVVKQRQARKRTLTYMLKQFFDDSPELLVNNLLEANDLDKDTLARLRQRIQDAEEGEP